MKRFLGCLLLIVIGLAIGCQSANGDKQEVKNVMETNNSQFKTATFAGGCFWCTEADFEKVPGVVKVISGYTGGSKDKPTYEEVSAGKSGHVEAVQVYYDPAKITYDQLLDVFWRDVDPTDGGGQFVDRGSQYRSVIFYHNDDQRQAAEKSKEVSEQIRTVR